MNEQNFNCDDLQELIPEIVDGEISAERLAAVEAHVAGCADCSALVRDVRGIVADAARLPAIAPPRDLWPEIAARIDAPVIVLGAGRSSPATARAARKYGAPGGRMRMLAAAAVLIAATATVTHFATRAWLPAAVDGETVATADALPGSDTGSMSTELAMQLVSTAEIESAYATEIGMLERIVRERRGELDEATVELIERNMVIIDAAIAECREALRADPASTFLVRSLGGALDRKLNLLRSAAKVPSGA